MARTEVSGCCEPDVGIDGDAMSNVYEKSIFPSYMPCIIKGKDAQGNRFPEHRSNTKDLNLTVKHYCDRHPSVVRVIVDVALNRSGT